MRVKRIIKNVATPDPENARSFYRDLLGLDIAMDHGWIQTYTADSSMAVQISFASEGGSGTPVPDLSVEVDDLDTALSKVHEAGIAVEYGPISEPWGVRRFYVRDPLGQLVNILQHQ